MNTRRVRFLVVSVLGVLVLWGLQQLLYPLEAELSHQFVRSFGADILERPVGVTTTDERVYVADTGNDRIVIFDRHGEMVATGGQTGSEPGEFRRPMRLETGPDGDLYVADLLNDRIQVFSPRGHLIRTYGENGNVSVTFNQPAGVDVDSRGNLYVVEFKGQQVQKLSPGGEQLRAWGVENTKGSVHYGYFNYPTDVGITRTDHVYVSDTFNDRVKHYGPKGYRLGVWGGFFGLNTWGRFRGWFKGAYGVGIAHDARRVYVTDFGNHRVQVFDRNGEFLTAFGTKGSGPGKMKQPTDVAVGVDGTVYVMDFANDRVQEWAPIKRGSEP